MGNIVLVGISGGVDSAVTLALLKNKGYAVSAVFLRFWDSGGKNNKALVDAKKVCEILGVPLRIIDARADFKKTVIKYFLSEYEKGNTPNPCVFCNEKMKFKLLFAVAKKMGIELVATGHYARIMKHITYNMKQGISNAEQELAYGLFPAKDISKDQSYFLYRLGQKELARIIFPLGEYEKDEVRKLAEKFRLPVFDKTDSQDVCFMDNGSLEEFLSKNIKLKKGKIVDLEGRILGEHKGLALYAIGQRKGIEIGGTGPYFVISKDMRKNILLVTNKLNHPAIVQKTIELEKVVWTSGIALKLPLAVSARTRYHNPLFRAIIKKSKSEKTCQLEFAQPQKAVSPGQSVVFYGKNEEILGGGVIR
ncbi:MAG: tRNA 2-thiouridine(34) synthase MnmA [Candidatus Moranbacteria bacterium]|nr:tRNA 2-thiouridine(34) synthase MnmA [Candidatus Moranbacteria bacterium]